MKSLHKRYRHLIGLFCIIGIALGLFMLGLPAPAGFGLVALWQLSQFAMSKKPGCCFTSVLTPEQVREFQNILDGLKGYDGLFKDLASWSQEEIKSLPSRLSQIEKQLKKNRLFGLSQTGVRWIGDVPFVTDDCAEAVMATYIIGLSKHQNAFENAIRDGNLRQSLLQRSCAALGVQKAALDATTTPLPTVYVPQVVELVWK